MGVGETCYLVHTLMAIYQANSDLNISSFLNFVIHIIQSMHKNDVY